MTEFILILLITTGGRLATTTATFDNYEACDHAGAIVSALRETGRVDYVCVPKKLEEPE